MAARRRVLPAVPAPGLPGPLQNPGSDVDTLGTKEIWTRDQRQSAGGVSTVSITWMTPFDASMSVMVTIASPT